MSKPVLHHLSLSPPSRFALITSKYVDVDLEVKEVDLFGGKHMTPEYKAINPTSTVPALVDGDTKVFESSAIAIYLVEKYAKTDALYPKELKLRTKVNERLFYVASYIFPRLYQMLVPIYFGTETTFPPKKIEEMMRGYQTIEDFLTGNTYLAGEQLTLCDLSLWCIMESLGRILEIDAVKFPNFTRWLNKMREEPTHELNKEGAVAHVNALNGCIARNRQALEK